MAVKDVEGKVEVLEKQLSEMQSAIRRMAQESNNLVSMVSKLSSDLTTVRGELATFKKEADVKAKAQGQAGVTRY